MEAVVSISEAVVEMGCFCSPVWFVSDVHVGGTALGGRLLKWKY